MRTREIRSFNCKVAEIGGHDALNFVDFKSSGIIDDLDIMMTSCSLFSQLDILMHFWIFHNLSAITVYLSR